MRGYLETMGVTELAIEAHEKGEADHDTIHTINLTHTQYKIKKMSRVNDLTVELTLGKELVKTIPPGDRVKKTLATGSEDLKSVTVVSSMPTINGVASVTDIKSIVEEENGGVVLVQQLTIQNELTGKRHTTTRYFVPHTGEICKPALTAGGNRGGGDYLDDEDD